MFDLNKSLEQWREQLKQGEAVSQDNIDELQEHLCEEMAALTGAGLSGEEAFLLAARRLGSIDVLKQEFEKVNVPLLWQNRLWWIAVGVLAYLGASAAEKTFATVFKVIAAKAHLNPYLAGVLYPLVSLAIIALVSILAVKAVARQRTCWQARNRGSLGARCLFLLCVLMWFTLLPLGSVLAVGPFFWHVTPEELGKMSIATYPGQIAISIGLPLVIAGWTLKRPRWVC